jgi:hypothetical protein
MHLTSISVPATYDRSAPRTLRWGRRTDDNTMHTLLTGPFSRARARARARTLRARHSRVVALGDVIRPQIRPASLHVR